MPCCRMVRIRESVGALRLVNARDAGSVMDEVTRKGLDIDQGMVLKVFLTARRNTLGTRHSPRKQ